MLPLKECTCTTEGRKMGGTHKTIVVIPKKTEHLCYLKGIKVSLEYQKQVLFTDN